MNGHRVRVDVRPPWGHKSLALQRHPTLPPTFRGSEEISRALIDDVCGRLAAGRAVHHELPGGGVINVDRLLPFLCVYRRNPKRRDDGTAGFVTSESAYLTAPGDMPQRKGLRQLVRRIAETAAERLGSFLLLEVWAGEDSAVPREKDPVTGEPLLPRPAFRVQTRTPYRPEGTTAKLEYALQRVKVHRMSATVEVDLHARNHPPGMTQLISPAECARIGCHVLGLEVRPIYRGDADGNAFVDVSRKLRRGVSRALKQAFVTFAIGRTRVRPEHYYSFGRNKLPRQLCNVDRQLADVSSQFKFLLLVTPVNSERAWRSFEESGYATLPPLQYRPQDRDPLLLRRRLLNIRTEEIEDPTLAQLMRETQDDLDRQITMLADLGSRNFLPGSLQVFGRVDPKLLSLAKRMLRRWPAATVKRSPAEEVGAKEFARRANREIEYYREQSPTFTGQALVRKDMYSGLLSTGGNLLVGRETTLARGSVNALLQHEIGTHLVTYYNGQAQPLQLLKVGLAGYDELQEGLAVLSEYLAGGLTRKRLRTLAARVVAASMMSEGADFPDTFAQLSAHGIAPKEAFTISLRVFRGGGLTKDIVYLRGLADILDYVKGGGDLEPLLVGKIARNHVPVVRELLLRGVLKPPLLRPRYLSDPDTAERLARLRAGCTVLDLLDGDA